jgi:diguanylate cyclase (GGDEF)-like protein
MAWLRSRHDFDYEPVLIGVTAGVLWLVAALAAGVAQLLPGAPTVQAWVFIGLDVAIATWGAVSVIGWVDWSRFTVERHVAATATLLPLIGVALWATGGQESYLQPLVVLPLVHCAYFFPPRAAIALMAELIAVEATPLLYDGKIHNAYPSRLFAFAVAALMLATVLRMLKVRLLAAEARQAQMARSDALTGLPNRRLFDEALQDVAPGMAIVLFDLDGFKGVNDTRGHAAGDELLRTVAAHCHAVIRPTDTLARIGGDEFALLAPGAGEFGARRLAEALAEAVRHAGAAATVAWAVHPVDGADEDELLRTADRRLYEGKAVHASQTP